MFDFSKVLDIKIREPTFLKLDLWSPGAGFIPIITSNVLKKIQKKRMYGEKLGFMHTKFFKLLWWQIYF